MSKRTTQQRLARSVAALTGGVVLIVALLINLLMLITMYRGEMRALRGEEQIQRTRRIRSVGHTQSFTPAQGLLLQEYTVWRRLAKLDDERYLYDRSSQRVRIVTDQIIRLSTIAWWSLGVVMIVIGLSYRLSLVVTRRGFAAIQELATHVQGVDIEHLTTERDRPSLPSHDVVARLADSIHATHLTLHSQIQKIKQFAVYAAHELNSPLMAMQGSTELLETTGDIATYLPRIQDHLQSMQMSIQTLLGTVDTHRGEACQTFSVSSEISGLIVDPDEATYQIHGDQSVTTTTAKGSWTTVVHNLLANASKYHESTDPITITCDTHQLTITNTTYGLDPEHIDRFVIPFWQADTGSEGSGLGLSLVERLCEIYDRSLSYRLTGDQIQTIFVRNDSTCTSSS